MTQRGLSPVGETGGAQAANLCSPDGRGRGDNEGICRASLGLGWLIVVLAWYGVRWFRERRLPSNASRGTAMRWATGAALLLVAIVAAGALWFWVDSRVQPLPSDAAVTTIVEERLAAGFGTAMVVGISDGGVRRFIARGDGVSGPASADTPFEIASITKVLTSSLLAVMAEFGDLSFDDAAASLWRATPPRMPDRAGKPVTLGDLAAHIAGLPKMPDDLVSTDVRDPEAGYTAERLDAFLARYEAPSPPFGYRYSNVGFAVLGQALGERSGVSLRRSPPCPDHRAARHDRNRTCGQSGNPCSGHRPRRSDGDHPAFLGGCLQSGRRRGLYGF